MVHGLLRWVRSFLVHGVVPDMNVPICHQPVVIEASDGCICRRRLHAW